MTSPATQNPEFEALLNYLKEVRNFDFAAYKRSSLMRRVRKRMQTVQLESFVDYLDYLQVHQDEFEGLFNTILINVTSFFRDEPAWEFLKSQILPRTIQSKKSDEPIRAWSAGCASGEEAYSLGMLLAEALGAAEFRQRVKIYATDVDEEALATARQATYSAKTVGEVPEDLRGKYFTRAGDRYTFSKDLRRMIIFGRHDLLQDAPISKVDLLVCRNTLMYFNSDAQARILGRFHYALNDSGYLFVGKAETLMSHGRGFVPVDMKLRVFAKTSGRMNMRDRLLFLAPDEASEAPPPENGPPPQVQDLLFEADLVPQLVIDSAGTLLLANRAARDAFGIRTLDVGRPFQDIEASYKPVELRSVLTQVFGDRRPVTVHEVHFMQGVNQRWLDVQVTPLLGEQGRLVAAKVSFNDITRARDLADELTASKRELETAYEELQSSNEELETTNEELQSTIEELETTNEELQSTNEELETMNEELQSTNEELETVNDELRERGNQLNQANAFMESILTSLRVGVMVIDSDQRVRAWNRRAEDLWGVRGEEALGSHFLSLDIGLKLDALVHPIRDCLAGKEEGFQTEVEAANRRGRTILCRVTCSPMAVGSAIRGAVVLMEELPRGEDQPDPGE